MLRKSALGWEIAAALGAAVLLSMILPLAAWPLLRRRLGPMDGAAVAATYGSVSAVTFVAATASDFHVVEESVRRAVRDRSSFNVIHEATLVKADLYVAPDDSLHREQFARSRTVALRDATGSEMRLASPEDVVVHELRWFAMGGGVSDRQWETSSAS